MWHGHRSRTASSGSGVFNFVRGEGSSDLAQVGKTLRDARVLANPRDRREQQGHQKADDGDDDQYFDQAESG